MSNVLQLRECQQEGLPATRAFSAPGGTHPLPCVHSEGCGWVKAGLTSFI